MACVNQEDEEKAGLFPTMTVYRVNLVGSMACLDRNG